ncbi:MAG TPA: ABC transporter permease [Opitutaceae bacterium]|nr:ABC transporter permease [Opitutaceae bacterium]
MKSAASVRPSWFSIRQPVPTWAYRTVALLTFLTLLAVWQWVSTRPSTNAIFVPTPARVVQIGRDLLHDAEFWSDVKMSFLRVTYGFLLSAALALPLGLLMGSFHLGEALIQPVTEFIRYIPVPALIPILMIVFGIGELSKVMLIFIGTFFQLVLMVADETRRVPFELVQVSYTLGARRDEVVNRVLLRAAMPGIFDAMRLCHGWAWSYVIVAELVAANEGLGYRILKFSRFLQTPKIWFYLLVLGVIGLALDFAFRVVGRRLFTWADTTKR